MHNKRIYQLAGWIMALVMILGSTIRTQAAPFVAQTAGPSIYWGAMVDGKVPSSTNMQPGGIFDTFETRSKKKMSIIHWGQPWVLSDGSWGEFQTSYYDNVRNHGSIPMVNWGSWKLGGGADQADFQLRDIYNGNYDAYIQRWATAAKTWGHPLFAAVRPRNERLVVSMVRGHNLQWYHCQWQQRRRLCQSLAAYP